MAYSLKKTLASCVTAVGVAALAGSVAQAQIGNGSSDRQLNVGSGVVVHTPGPRSASSSGPSGAGASRLPTTTPAAMPINSAARAVPTQMGVAGNSRTASRGSGVGNQAFGTSSQEWPYSHQRVAVLGAPYPTSTSGLVPVTSRPYRWAGKLWMRFGTSWFVCSAALIKKGLLVTAAHCVHNYGQRGSGWANEVRFYPANSSSSGSIFGYYLARIWYIPTVYYNGTDTCQSGAVGVVCNNDIATVVLHTRGGRYAGQSMGGWYGYGWNGYSYARTSNGFGGHTIAEINQLGYPVALDSGYQMQRNNSFGKLVVGRGTNGRTLLNTQLGSAMTGGSSGGPWIVNFGMWPSVNTSAAFLGFAAARNIIVGVTSWGYTDPRINVQGASWFGQNAEFPSSNYGGRGAGNIGALVNAACTAFPAYC